MFYDDGDASAIWLVSVQSYFIFHLFILRGFESDMMTLYNEHKKVTYMRFLKKVLV